MIAVIDYGLSNLRSVMGAVEKLKAPFQVTNRPNDIDAAEKIILPGVGAFEDGMRNLRNLGLIETLTKNILKDKKPILGICLGAQLMCEESFEFGHHQGLNWLDASVVKFETNSGLRIPHVGWNDLFQIKKSILFEGIPEDSLFYYVHSYHIKCHDQSLVLGESDYGGRFTAVLQKSNIYATQFHPEKSQLHGLTFLKNFLEKS